MNGDTIVALCTTPGRAALSVIKLSGPKALQIIKALADFLPDQPKSHRLYFGTLRYKKQDLDQVLLSYFEKGKSFTGEESLEISCHGGEVYADILKALIELGARPADRGEFSFRAFSNGKMDLIQAEALLQLIEGESLQARQKALFQLRGQLSKHFLQLEKQWLFLLSHIEADIDFSLENLNTLKESTIQKKLEGLRTQVQELLSSYKPFELLQKGLSFGIFGISNVGKSSLFNALLKEEKAIVSQEEGTTRDIVEATVSNPKGLNIVLKDCAGFRKESKAREGLSLGEQKGQERSRQLFQECDYRLLLVDCVSLAVPTELFKEKQQNTWLLWTKSDLLAGKAKSFTSNPKKASQAKKKLLIKKLKQKHKDLKLPKKSFLLSSLSGEGIEELKKELLSCGDTESSRALISNSRHFQALMQMKKALENCKKIRGERDIMALELRQGLLALYEILGKHIEDRILDQIFKQFCIGK